LLDVCELKHLADTAFALDHLVVDEVRKMKEQHNTLSESRFARGGARPLPRHY
jgi:hypothetical protein